MIKRREYHLFHQNGVNPSDSDSDSDSDSGSRDVSLEESAEASEEEEVAEQEPSSEMTRGRGPGHTSQKIDDGEESEGEGSEDEGEGEGQEEADGTTRRPEAGHDGQRANEQIAPKLSVPDRPLVPSKAKKRPPAVGLGELHSDDSEDAGEGGFPNCRAAAAGKSQWEALVDEEEGEDEGARRVADMEEGGLIVRAKAGSAVLKCRLCPKTLCLNEAAMDLHLASKKHARSAKQLALGTLKVWLNSDGEQEEEAETHAERLARVRAAAVERPAGRQLPAPKRKPGGRQRQQQRKRLKVAAAKAGGGAVGSSQEQGSQPRTKKLVKEGAKKRKLQGKSRPLRKP